MPLILKNKKIYALINNAIDSVPKKQKNSHLPDTMQ